MTNPTPHGQVPEALIDLIDEYAETRHRCGGIYNARTEAARKAVIEALSGVQALSAAPADVPEYVGNGMFKGETIQKAAEHWANWCDVRCMTGLSEFLRVVAASPPAEQQAASSAVLKAIREANMQLVRTGDDAFMLVPYKVATTEAAAPKAGVTTGAALGGVYAELPAPLLIQYDEIDCEEFGCFAEGQMRDFADRTHALRMQAATKAAPVTQQAGYAEVIECGNSYAKVKLKGEAFGSTKVGDIFYTAPQPAPAIGDELRDTLVAVSAAIAERDDRAAQKMICEILAASTTPPAEQQATKETSGGFHVWRDISTAPKDGSRFVATGHNYGLYSEVRHTCVAQWFRGCWMEVPDWNETSELKYLTHWMPLPSPPDDVAAPAEQQAQPGAVYAELPQPDSWFHFTAQFWENKLYDFADRTHALRMQAAPKAAPTRTALPEGWTDCTIEFGNDGPEVVAYGPKRMMTRLAKWLGKYFAQVIAEAAPKAAPGAQNTVPAEWLEQAYREGWAACRDAETIGEEAEDWAFGNSTANSRMIDAQQAAPKQEVQEPHGWLYEWTHSSATGKPDSTYTAFTTDEAHARKHDNCRAIYTAPQPAPATQQAGDVVAYLDVGAGGYLDLGSELSEDALQQLPKGRHALVIAGTYGIDGYVAAPQPSPTTKPAPQQEAQEPCPTCVALARAVMLDQVSFDRKPDCYGIRQITDDESVEEWEDIRTSPDVAREEANDMMATGRGEIYEVVPLWTTPQLAPQPAPAELERLRERIARMGLDVDRAMRGHVNEQSPLGTQRLAAIAALVKPKPAPPSDDVVKDAARYRFLAGHCRSTSEHWGGRWSIVVDGPAPKSHDSEDDFDEAVDAAIAAQRGNK